jgi:hypothetical protein
MVSETNKLQLYDPFITLSRISIGDEHSRPIFISKNLTQEVAKNESDPMTTNLSC